MNSVWHLAVKDLRVLVRDKAGFFFALFFPLIYATFFGTIFSASTGGGDNPIKIALVDEDETSQSQALIEQLGKAKGLSVVTLGRAAAVERVRTGKLAAYVVIAKGYGAARERAFWGPPPVLQLGLDPSKRAEGAMLQGLLTEQMVQRFQDLFSQPQKMTAQLQSSADEVDQTDPAIGAAMRLFAGALDQFMHTVNADEDSAGKEPDSADSRPAAAERDQFNGFQPVRFETAEVSVEKRNYYAVSFPQGIIWGVMGCAAGFGISLVSERSGGTLVRLRMAPISRTAILAGKALACLMMVITVAVVMLIVARLAFGVRPTSPALLTIAVGCVAICFTGIMMLLAVLGRTERAASGIGWAILTVMAMIGGGMIPAFVMPAWMQTIGQISPVYWSIYALDGSIWRGLSANQLAGTFGVLLAIGAACFGIGAWRFRWAD